MTEGILLRETSGQIRILTINRPERSNAMSPELTEELIDAFVVGPKKCFRFKLEGAQRGKIVLASVVTFYAKVFRIHVTTPFSPNAASTIDRATFLGIGAGS